jgi:hypothetical protein
MGFTPIGGAALILASVALMVAALSRYPGRALLAAPDHVYDVVPWP